MSMLWLRRGLKSKGKNGFMSEYKGESRSMWRYTPKRDAERTLLNDSFCSSLKNDIKGERTFLIFLITAASRNARRVPQRKSEGNRGADNVGLKLKPEKVQCRR